MNRQLKVKILLLISCILADAAMPLFLPDQQMQAMEMQGEPEAEQEKGYEEEPASHDKIMEKQAIVHCSNEAAAYQKYIEHDLLAKQAITLPILTPPPQMAG
jgi:hypothetical protein